MFGPSAPARLAILLDGEYVKKVLHHLLRRFPTPEDVMAEVSRIRADADLSGLAIYRVFYYTAEPLAGPALNPLSGVELIFDRTPTYARNRRLIDRIENQPDVAVRLGTLVHQGWEIGRAALRALTDGRKTSVDAVVTGDSDLVPAMKLARREGVRVYLDTLGQGHVRPELKKHADRILAR